MGILEKIRDESKKSGQSKGKFIYFRDGVKTRIRFLNDLNEGMEIVFHDSYEKGINVPCQEIYGKSCPYCDDEELRTRSMFAWSVYDYEAKEVKILMQAVNNCTAVPALMALYENYQTLTDRDLVVQRTGKAQNTAYSVVPMDKNKFRNEKAKPLSEKAILKYIAKAYPVDSDDDDYDDENDDEIVNKRVKEASNKAKRNSQRYKEDDDWDDEESGSDYSEMSARELYDECKDRGIDCKPKKPQKYYLNLLEEDDKAHDDWDDDESEDDDDEWGDE